MLQFLSRPCSVLAGAVMLVGVAILPESVLSQSTVPAPPSRPPTNSLRLLVIQGKVTNIRNNVVTVDTTPFCPPNTPCILISGPKFDVNISRTVFQSASGTPISSPKLKVGDSIVVAGREGAVGSPGIANRVLIAEVIEKNAFSPGG